MSTYGDAFAITPQRSLPREKAAEMLERISQLNEEYEERKEIEDNPAYRQLLERQRDCTAHRNLLLAGVELDAALVALRHHDELSVEPLPHNPISYFKAFHTSLLLFLSFA